MGASIVDIRNMGDALRNTGYKNIESAVAEIIDNSVEANAKNIFVILREGIATSGRKVVTEIGFLDNGDGMSGDTLEKCLGIGASTRHARKGMGRFGVGLPQASLYACPEIEVYSWQNGIENAQKVYLDINKIKDGVQTEIEDPEVTIIPEPYASYIHYQTILEQYDFSKSGTLVIWKKCDRINPKTRGPLTERLEFSLGQKFRYFIHDGVSKIKIVCDENPDAAIDVAPNDPLFLMEDNCVLCKESEPKRIYKPGQESGIEEPFELYTAKGTGTGEVASLICDIIHNYANNANNGTSFDIYLEDVLNEERCKNKYPGLWKDACVLWKVTILSRNYESPKLLSDILAEKCNISRTSVSRKVEDQIIQFDANVLEESEVYKEFQEWISEWKFSDGAGKIKIKNLFMHLFLKYDLDKNTGKLKRASHIVRTYAIEAIKQDLDHMDASRMDKQNKTRYFHYNLTDRTDFTNGLGNMIPLPVAINRGKHNTPMKDTMTAFSEENLTGWIFEEAIDLFQKNHTVINNYEVPTEAFFNKRKDLLIAYFKRIVKKKNIILIMRCKIEIIVSRIQSFG